MRYESPIVLLMAGSVLLVPVGATAEETRTNAAHPNATAAVQVTQNPNPVRIHAAPLIGVNPRTGELVIVEIEARTTMACSAHVSPDHGRRWFPGGALTQNPYTDCGSDQLWSNNTWLTFGKDGTLYVAFIAHDPRFNDRGRAGVPRNVFLARSTNSGRSFTTAMVYKAPEELDQVNGTHTNRLPQVAVDPKDSSRLYVSWQDGGSIAKANRALIAASGDGGRTFSKPVNLTEDLGDARHPRITVDGDGVVHSIVPMDDGPRPVYYRRSTDRAQTWSKPFEFELQRKEPGVADIRRNRKWVIQADPNSSRLYFAWYGTVEPKATLQNSTNDVFLQVSPDAGKNWNEPVRVNDDVGGVQQYDPNISVAPNGRIDIAWLDFRNSPYPEAEATGSPFNYGGFQDLYSSHSTDGGNTLTANVRVTDRSINREIGAWSNSIHMHGHVGLASTNDTVYFTWQDSRNGDKVNQAEDVYFASYQHEDVRRVAAAGGHTGLRVWTVGATALVLGMGIAMVLSVLLLRRTRRSTGVTVPASRPT